MAPHFCVHDTLLLQPSCTARHIVDDRAFWLALGAALRVAYMARGWTPAELARRAGVSHSDVSRLENGHIYTEVPGALRRICAALDLGGAGGRIGEHLLSDVVQRQEEAAGWVRAGQRHRPLRVIASMIGLDTMVLRPAHMRLLTALLVLFRRVPLTDAQLDALTDTLRALHRAA